MDIGGVFIIYLSNTRKEISRFEFRKTFSRELGMDYLRYRSTVENLPRQLKVKIKELVGIEEDSRLRLQGHCAYCLWWKNQKTKLMCYLYDIYLCKEYTSLCKNF